MWIHTHRHVHTSGHITSTPGKVCWQLSYTTHNTLMHTPVAYIKAHVPHIKAQVYSSSLLKGTPTKVIAFSVFSLATSKVKSFSHWHVHADDTHQLVYANTRTHWQTHVLSNTQSSRVWTQRSHCYSNQHTNSKLGIKIFTIFSSSYDKQPQMWGYIWE